MAIEAQLADGRILEFPDGTDPSVVQATVKRVIAQSAPPVKTTALGQVKEGFKGILPGAIGLVESAATGASALLPDDMEKSAREKIKSVATAAKAPFAAGAGYENSVGRRVGEGLGSIVPAVPLAFLGAPGIAAGVGLGLAAGAGESRTRAEGEGATAEQRSTATALGTIPGGFDTAIDMALAALPGGVGRSLSVVRRALLSGGVEGATEAAQAIAQNAIAKGVYKPNQALLEGSGEEGAYGAGVGALASVLLDMAIPGRRAQSAQAPKEPPAAQPGAQLPADAAPGTQGTLFTPEEMGAPVPAPKEPKEPVAAGVPAGQQDLGLDFQREYPEMALERERLRQQPQTPEVKARIAELSEQMALYTQSDIESMRAEKEGQAAAAQADAEARKRFPALAEAPDLLAQPDEVKARTQGELFPGEDLAGPTLRGKEKPTEEKAAEPGEPTPVPPYTRKGPYQYKLPLRGRAGELTMKNVEDTGIAPSTTRTWFEQNVVGKTQAEVQALVDKDPTLLVGNGKRAKILRELLAPQAAPFKEAPSVKPTPTKTPAVEQRDEPRAGEPSVGVPSEPAAPVVPEPGAGAPAAAEAPVTPDGRGLVSAGRPAVPRAEPKGGKPAAVEAPVPEAPKPPVVQRLEAAKTRAEFDAALDELVAIQRSVNHPDKDAVGEFIGANVRFPEFERALQAAERRNRPAQPAPAPVAAAQDEETSEPKKKAAPRKPDAFYEPVRIDRKTGKVIRGKQLLIQPIDDASARRMLEKRAEEDAGTGEDVRDLFGDIAEEIDAEASQPELDFTKEPEPEPEPEPKVAATTTWSGKHALGGQQIVYEDADVALVRAVNAFGEVKYFAMDASGNQALRSLESAQQPSWLTADQKSRLETAMKAAQQNEAVLSAANADGPFTTGENVVATESIGPALQKYTQNLLQSIGLGDLKVFLYNSPGMAASAGAVDKHHLYGAFATPAKFHKDGLNGSVVPFGPDGESYALYLKAGMSESKTLEILAHEIGHIVERTAYDSADAATRKAIQDEFRAWQKQAKQATTGELMHMLRNREDAEFNADLIERSGKTDVPAAQVLSDLDSYWTSFGEWFADNVSRWATTNEKPLSIADKFFSKIAQKMRDLVAIVTGRKYPPAKSVADFLNKAGPANFRPQASKAPAIRGSMKEQFSVAPSTEALIDSMGPMEAQEKPMLRKVIDGFKDQTEVGYGVKFRTQVADSAATIEHRLRSDFDGAVRDKLGKFNPMGLYRQAQDYSKMLLEYMQVGAIAKEPATGLWKVKADPKVRPPVEVYSLIDKWAAKNGYSRERGTQIASRILEGVRLDAMRTANKNDGTSFLLHLKDNEIDQLVREYKADPELQAMSKAMDEARLAMVDNMVKVGRLSAEQGQVWKDAAGYVPFDRIEDFATSFTKIKKVSNKGLAQVGKLPELVGSINRPVGNVFDNYLNTLGWMVGQTMKTDATVQTLRSLEDAGHAKFLGRSPQGKDNAVGMYVKGEMMYWELPSKYDVLAFKDLNPPKAKWLQILGGASNILRKAVTVLPPFALKQVTDDVQRAIMTSGVKNPGALLRMTLSNFGGLALAELRGIQHPTVKEFGALGLTGEYDFQQGKPATSVLKDLGYKPRGKYETLIHRLDGITRASDLAVRKAIYDQTIKEGGDQLLAQTRAREFINFRRRGASDFVGAMVTTIPFFNAYIQGMDVLYRAASGKDSSSSVNRAQARRMFYSRAAMAITLSSLYALGKGDDDEDYNEMDLRTRDNNWILGGGLKIGVPTELGALFKVIPERIVEYMRRQGTPEEQEAWEATRTALSYIMEQYVGRVVPVPQGVKPLLEAWTNYSFFTGRELEGIYQKQQDPSLRRASNTSELAIAIANFSKDIIGVDKVSPIMIDNALNGYFGSTAGLLVAMTDSLLNPTRVDRPLHKYALISNYMYDPVGTRRMTEFYEEREKVGRANATLRELMKTDLDKAAEYAEKNADKLMLESAVNSTLEQLERTRAYKKYINSPLGAEDMSKEEREAQIKEIRQMEVELTSWLREAKVAVRQ